MDDIYSHLENFNEVNMIDELKCENKELKLKLEEYSTTLSQLQKDFDKLSSEYNKLEINYSSLLKTARAEIERKTEMIKNLNIEKDMLVIKSLQNTGQKNLRPHHNISNQTQSKKDVKESSNEVKTKQSSVKSADRNDKREVKGTTRSESLRTSSVDTVSSVSTEIKSATSDEIQSRKGNSSGRNNNKSRKEHSAKDQINNDPKPKENMVKKIINRRKSMPVFSQCEAKFSSDDDLENCDDKSKNRSPKRDDSRHYDRYYDKRENKNDYYDSSRDMHRSVLNRNIDYDIYRNSNRNEFQHSRRYSPERNYRPRESADSHHLRSNDSRQRISRSPPSERYGRSKSRDRRPRYERDNFRDYDKHSYHQQEYKVKNDFDEPRSKRPKIEYNKHTMEDSYFGERKHVERPMNLHPEELQFPSCQSPDYDYVESHMPQPCIREIKHTAQSKLDDPRIESRKYIVQKNQDKTVLLSLAGQNVNMKQIDKSSWGKDENTLSKSIPSVKPLAKLSDPAELTEELVNEIYMDIDGPVLNMSLESGELYSIDENEDDKLYASTSECKKMRDEHVQENTTIVPKINSNKTGKYCAEYKIPKIKNSKKCLNTQSSSKNEVHDTVTKKIVSTCGDFNISVETKHLVEIQNENIHTSQQRNKKECIKNAAARSKGDSNDKKDKLIRNFLPEVSADKKSMNNDAKDDVKSISCKKSIFCQNAILGTVEGDLELSDDASDNMDLQKEVIEKNTVFNEPLKVFKQQQTPIDDYFTKTENETQKQLNTTETKQEKKSIDSKRELPKDNFKESKKRKSRRKTQEVKETSSTLSKDPSVESHQTKKSKEKLNKSSISNQTKSKFSDLFGDTSSSLITPDDLGIPGTEILAKPSEKYIPIFENTQDAVDLSVEDIKKVKTQAEKCIETIIDEIPKEKVDDKISDSAVDDTTASKEYIVKDILNDPKQNNLYENAKSETLVNTSDIVKTIVISSGVQPNCLSHNVTSECEQKIIKPNIDVSNLEISKKGIVGNNDGTSICLKNTNCDLQALATSTPHKLANIEIAPPALDLNSNTNNKTKEINLSANIIQTSNSNSNNIELQNEADVPDVRIFVRRRRKVAKKAV